MAVKLTDRAVAAAQCPVGRKDMLLFDDVLKGFGVRVMANGRRVFLFQYNEASAPGGKRRVTLGTFGDELTTIKARRKAEALRGQVRDGRDPSAERRAARAAAQAVEAKAKAAAASAGYTVDAMIGQWEAHHLAERSASYRLRIPREMRAALAEWHNAPAGLFGREDAVRVLDHTKTARGPIAANRLHAVARACWGWAMKRGALGANPWASVPRPSRETARERVLMDTELATLWKAADRLGAPWPGIIRLMLLTGQRRGEVAGMRWEEVHLDAGQWTLPGERTKNGRPHTVPLAPAALDVLRGVEKRKDALLVFEGARRTTPSGFGKISAALNAALADAAKQAGRKPAPFVLHDIRRSMATGFQRLGIRLEVTEAMLNHVSGSRSGIVGVYQRHGWAQEKAAAAEAWAAHLLAEVAGAEAGGNVVALATATRTRAKRIGR